MAGIDLFLVQYKVGMVELNGYHICSTRERARDKAIQLLSGCKNVSHRTMFVSLPGHWRDFGDFSKDWSAGCIWAAFATFDYHWPRRKNKREDYVTEEDVVVDIHAVQLNGASAPSAGASDKVYLIERPTDNNNFTIFTTAEAARLAAVEELLQAGTKVVEGALSIGDHSDFAGVGCVWWAWERVYNEETRTWEQGDHAATIYEITVDGPLAGTMTVDEIPETIRPEKGFA